jgi:micrococcal nuclease
MSDSKDTRARSRALLALTATVAVVAVAAAVAAAWQLNSTSASAPAAAPTSAPARTAPAAATAQTGLIRVTVARVVDGDTIHVTMPDGADETIRFIGVNTPESTTRHEPYGEEASAYAKKRLPKGLTVWLETDVGLRDRYGRMLAYVWLAEPTSGSVDEVRSKMFNAELLIEGYAQLMTIPPDVRYVDVFTPLQAEAREATKGLWGLPAK